MPKSRYFLIIKRVGLLLFLYSLCRFFFFLFNQKAFASAEFTNVLLAFFYGLRFDLSIIFSSNLLFLLFNILPFPFVDSRAGYKISKGLYFFVNIPLLLMNMADVEYFKFTSKRTGYDVLGIIGDVKNQSLQLVMHYWYVPLVLVLFILFLLKYYGPYEKQSEAKIKNLYAWLALPLVAAFSVVIIRGGFQYKPLKPDHAFVLSPNVLGNLVLNTPYNFFTTLSFQRVAEINYFSTDKEVKKLLEQNQGLLDTTTNKTNIVIIILESFSREYMGIGDTVSGYTPFLDSLAKQNLFFDHHFANGKRSIEAVPAILASIPSLMEESYITGVYQANEIHGLAELLRGKGYHTAFFHGGKNGTMGFDKFALNAGFNEYYGLDEYPDEKDFDGNWGIYDEPYLNYFCQTLTGFRKPFMASVFTLSSHQPYSIPGKYKGVFPKGTLEIHESIGYADYALRKFFECASTKDWYKNTLFVITADHTQGLTSQKYLNSIGEYRVPLILFHPGKIIKADTTQITQHVDIMPTVLQYTGIANNRPILFGRSVLNASEGKALFYTNKTYVYVKKDYFIEFDNIESAMYKAEDWNKKQKIITEKAKKAQYEKELKANIQYYNNGLNNNNWYHFGN
jgi:phosphoglycerol transferase MdoB-like AlkP superfamily enzyme